MVASAGGVRLMGDYFMKFLRPLSVCITLALASCVGGGGSTRSEYGDRAGPKGFTTVVIDAGHGGKDSGAPGRLARMPEKQVALAIAKRVQARLSPQFRTVMTRSSDRFIELDDRAAFASRYGNGVVVSIHLNSGPSRLCGPETYYWRTDSYSLARRVQRNLSVVASYENGNRGLVRRRLRLTRNTTIPGILVECGYLSNGREASLLASAGYQDRIAGAIAQAVSDQRAYGDAGMGPLPKPIYAPISRATDRRE
jgi:N-acetylmuramoyl-L-alanine amidase